MNARDFEELIKNTPKRDMNKKPVGRFAPSPTGYIHLGNVWASLLAWLSVRKQGGTMILRVEDLDPARSKPEYIQRVIDDLKWLGLDWDEGPGEAGAYGPYYQDARRDIYERALNWLKETNSVYPCFCTRKELRAASAPHREDGVYIYSGKCKGLSRADQEQAIDAGKRHAWRIKVPDRVYGFDDLNYGWYAQNLQKDCGDFLLARTDGVHAYQLAVVVDDGLMGVDLVVRGSDLIDSSPRQIFLHETLGFEPPRFGHVPLLKGEDATRLSKRHKSLDLEYLRENGCTAEKLMGLLGYEAGLLEKIEPVKAHELIALFDWGKLPKKDIVITDKILLNL